MMGEMSVTGRRVRQRVLGFGGSGKLMEITNRIFTLLWTDYR
jgi:hypothetical protein